jgi:Coenzyme PQQ synthesis protein D (PqqD)
VESTISREAIYKPSDDLVVREIDGQLIIVPIGTGIGDLEDELYALNDMARVIWTRLDGVRTLGAVIAEITREYAAPAEEIDEDVVGLLDELLKRRMVVPV